MAFRDPSSFFRSVLLYLLCVLVQRCIAQDPVHRRLTVVDGLPSDHVYGVFQDRDGFIWFGTDAGASRFDGRSFVNFSVADGLPDNEVLSCKQDTDGRIWFLLLNGKLCYYKDGVLHHEGTDSLLAKASGSSGWTSMCEVGERLWFGGVHGELLWIEPDKDRFGTFHYPAGVCSVFRNGEHGACMMKGNVLYPLGEDGPDTARSTPMLDLLLYQLIIDPLQREGHPLGMQEGAIVEINGTQLRNVVGLPPKYLDARIHDRCWRDGEGNIWMRRRDRGIDLLAYDQGSYRPTAHLFGDEMVNSALVDRDGNTWLPTNKGVIMYTRSERDVVRFSGTHAINTLCLDSEGLLWAGGDDGSVYRCGAGHAWKVFTGWDAAFLGNIYRIATARNGDLLLATDHALLEFSPYDPGGATAIPYVRGGEVFHTGRGALARAVICAPSGRIFSTVVGLNEVVRDKDGPRRQIIDVPGAQRSRVYALHEDRHGGLWFETNNLLNVLDGDSVRSFPSLCGQAGVRINDITAYKGDTLVLATSDRGLLLVKDGAFVASTNAASNTAFKGAKRVRMVGDTIWSAGPDGVFAFVLRGGSLEEVVGLTRNSGLPTTDARDVLLHKGRLYVATDAGLCVLSPIAGRQQDKPLVLHFSQVLLNDSLLPPSTRHFELHTDRDRLSIVVQAITYDAMEKVVYEYRIGPDAPWTPLAGGRIDLVSMASGEYRFEARARRSNGVWSSPVLLVFDAIDPWYERTWAQVVFWLSGTLLVVGGVLLLLRVRHQRELDRLAQEQMLGEERRRIAMDVHDDLGADLSRLLSKAGTAVEDGRTDDDHATVAELADGLKLGMEKIDDIIWSLDPGRDDLRSTVDFIESWVRSFVHSHGLRFTSDLEVKEDEQAVHAIQRREISLVVKECVRNVIKHAGASHVHLLVRYDMDILRIVVEDDGVRSPSDTYNGERNGSLNMRRRAGKLNGKLSFTPMEPKGTRCTLSVIIPKGSSEVVMRKSSGTSNLSP